MRVETEFPQCRAMSEGRGSLQKPETQGRETPQSLLLTRVRASDTQGAGDACSLKPLSEPHLLKQWSGPVQPWLLSPPRRQAVLPAPVSPSRKSRQPATETDRYKNTHGRFPGTEMQRKKDTQPHG